MSVAWFGIKRSSSEVRTNGASDGPLEEALTVLFCLVDEVCLNTYAFYVTRLLGGPQGRIKELWP